MPVRDSMVVGSRARLPIVGLLAPLTKLNWMANVVCDEPEPVSVFRNNAAAVNVHAVVHGGALVVRSRVTLELCNVWKRREKVGSWRCETRRIAAKPTGSWGSVLIRFKYN